MDTKATPYIGENSPLNRITTYFNALQSSAEEYLFVIDLETEMALLSDNFIRDFNFSSNVVDDFDNLVEPFIHYEDREIFEDALNAIRSANAEETVDCEFRLLSKDGEHGWVRMSMAIGMGEFERPEFLSGVIARMDIPVKADNITGLLKRNVFYAALQQELESDPRAHGAVVVIGLDNFHVITETYGHRFGDTALRQIAQNITNVLPPDIKLYKLDGYMFGMFMPYAMPEEVEIIFSSVQLCMREIRNVDDTIYCTASAGATFYPDDAKDVITLARYSEVALELARKRGRDQICFFEKEEYDRWRYDIGMQNLMQNSIARGCEDFFLCYQPQVDAKDGRLVGAEALLRWYDQDGSIVAPMQFIPMLEKSRMIIPVGHWIIENAVITAKKFQEFMPNFQMSVNISLYQLEERMFYPFVEDCVRRHAIDPTTLTFELTESHQIYDWDFVNKQFGEFHDLVIKIAMDDFGTGYSTMGFLKNFNCDLIKIDRMFVENILKSEYDRKLIKHMIMLCHAVGMEVCVEGIEQEGEYLYLRDECGADQIQGFFFGYPETEDVFLERFKK